MPDNQDTIGMRRVTDLPTVVAATSAPLEFQHLINPSASPYSSYIGNLEAVSYLAIPANLSICSTLNPNFPTISYPFDQDIIILSRGG